MPFRHIGALIACASLLTACTRDKTISTAISTPTGSATSASSARTTTPTPPRTAPLTTGPNVRPGEKPPTLDDAVATHDASGAREFAYYFFRALDWSIATNDAALVHPLVSSDCRRCAAAINNLDDLGRSHQKILGGRIRVEEASVVTGHFAFSADVVVKVSTYQSEERLVDQAGKVIHREPASSDVSLLFASWLQGSWKVVELGGES